MISSKTMVRETGSRKATILVVDDNSANRQILNDLILIMEHVP